MRKPSTTALRRRGKLQGEQLTIGLDLGDRSSFYLVGIERQRLERLIRERFYMPMRLVKALSKTGGWDWRRNWRMALKALKRVNEPL